MATYQLPFTGDTIKSELQQLVNNEFTNVMSQTSSPAPLADNDEIPTTGWVQDEISSQLATKVDKVTGKELSTNDYTNADKTNVDKIPSLLTEIQPIERGGTGATTSQDALENLGVADYVIETSSSGNWRWKKYADGTFEAWYLSPTEISMVCTTKTTDSWYRTANPLIINFPNEIGVEEVIYGNMNVNVIFAGFGIKNSVFSETSISGYATAPSSGTSNGRLTAYIYGTWA